MAAQAHAPTPGSRVRNLLQTYAHVTAAPSHPVRLVDLVAAPGLECQQQPPVRHLRRGAGVIKAALQLLLLPPVGLVVPGFFSPENQVPPVPWRLCMIGKACWLAS